MWFRLLILPFCVCWLLLVNQAAAEYDRAVLGRVIKSIPPNGEYWKFGNVVMRAKSKKAGMAPVVFPHWNHRALFTCKVCHQELEFGMRRGETGITRQRYLEGKYCGYCHDGSIAFTVKDGPGAQCNRCHMKSTESLEERFNAFAATMPVSEFGNGIDWASAIRSGQIKPRVSVRIQEAGVSFPQKLSRPLPLATTSPRSDVFFSHEEHFAELDCSSCHPDVFTIKRKGTELFSMESNIFGNYCGVCHTRVAFPMNDCRRCHPSMKNMTGF